MKNFKMFNAWFLTGIIILSAALTACGGSSSTTSEPADVPIGNTYWQLDSLTLEETGQVDAIPDSTVVLYFGESGAIFGFGGCNFMTGTYNLSADAISINADLSSAFQCPQDLHIQEQAFVGALSYMGSYHVEGEQMVMTNPNGPEEIKLSQIVPPPPLPGTDWKLQSYNDGQGALVTVLDGSEVTAQFAEDGNLSGFAGCNNYNTTYELDGEKISIGPVVSTLMACETPEGVMDQESAYLAALGNAVTYRNLVAGLIMLDENNKPVVFFISGVIKNP